MVKKTKIVLHINTGLKKENGNNKQMHVVLWNNDRNLDQFFGGVAEVAAGKLEVVTAPVEIEGKIYNNPAAHVSVFVNRSKKNQRVLSLSVFQDRIQTGELKFKKTINGKVLLSGTHNPYGIQFDENYKVMSIDGNRGILAEVQGGFKEEILDGMIDVGLRSIS